MEETLTISEAAHKAWELTAGQSSSAARHSFVTQMWRKIRIRSEEYEPDATFFADEFEPHLAIGVEIDGLVFCLNVERELSVISWRCAQKGCDRKHRAPFTDLRSLGKALASGEHFAATNPKCEAHSGRRV